MDPHLHKLFMDHKELPKGVRAALFDKVLLPNTVHRKLVEHGIESGQVPLTNDVRYAEPTPISESKTDTVDTTYKLRWSDCSRNADALELESPDNLHLQLGSIEHLIKNNSDDPKLWHRRKQIIGNRTDAATVSTELHFTKGILCMHPENKHCWSYRQWLLKAFHERSEKIEFCDMEFKLNGHTHNRFAWDERLLLVTKLQMRSIDEESDYAIKVIKEEPENGHPWMYLKALYRKVGFDEQKLHELFMFVFYPDFIHEWGASAENIRGGSVIDAYYETHIVLNRRKYINACEAILDLICFGYGLSQDLVNQIGKNFPYCLQCRIDDVLNCIDQILLIARPQRSEYLKMRSEQARLFIAGGYANDEDEDDEEDDFY